MSKRSIDFNKEIIIGGIGGLLGAPLFGFISSLITDKLNFISLATVLGAMIGASASWLIARIYYERKRKEFSVKKFTKDIFLYTPAALFIALLISYPTVFFITRFILENHMRSGISSFVGQLCGFIVFIVLINIYRQTLKHFFDIRL